MTTILTAVQIVLSILLVAAILLQQRGTGLSAAFGGEGNVYRTKRGLERGLFVGTIVIAALFIAAAILTIIIRK